MHILLVPSWYPSIQAPYNGSFFREQALMLARGGAKVGVLNIAPVRVEKFDWLKPLKVEDEDGLLICRGNIPTLPSQLCEMEARIIRMKAEHAAARYEHEAGIPDIVHAHSAFPGILIGEALSRKWNVPLVFTEHRPSSITGASDHRRTRKIKSAVREATVRIGVSREFTRALEEHYRGTTWETVELPVPDVFFNAAPNATIRRYRYCHVSHIDDNKRVDLMCRAFSRAFPYGDAELLVVGGNPPQINLLELELRRQGVDTRNIFFLGKRSREETAKIMADSDCFVLVSAVEAGGTVFSEAQAAGLPLIGSATWAGKSAINDMNGILVEIDDENALVKAFRRMMQEKSLLSREQIRQRACGLFSEQAFVQKSANLYGGAIAMKNGETNG